jgi:hypothetical protein
VSCALLCAKGVARVFDHIVNIAISLARELGDIDTVLMLQQLPNTPRTTSPPHKLAVMLSMDEPWRLLCSKSFTPVGLYEVHCAFCQSVFTKLDDLLVCTVCGSDINV